MSTPDSVHSPVVLPVIPRLTVVPRPLSSTERLRDTVQSLPPSLVVAAGLTAILTVGAFSGKMLAVNLSTLMFIDTRPSAELLGSISFLSVIVIALLIGLTQRVFRQAPAAQRLTRQVAAVVLALGYLHLLLWFTRAAAAAVAAAASGSLVAFMPSVFWWG